MFGFRSWFFHCRNSCASTSDGNRLKFAFASGRWQKVASTQPFLIRFLMPNQQNFCKRWQVKLTTYALCKFFVLEWPGSWSQAESSWDADGSADQNQDSWTWFQHIPALWEHFFSRLNWRWTVPICTHPPLSGHIRLVWLRLISSRSKFQMRQVWLTMCFPPSSLRNGALHSRISCKFVVWPS